MASTLTAYPSEQESLGYFRIYVRAPGSGSWQEITIFRGAPVTVTSVTTQDPFTDQTAQLSLPMVTIWDTPGDGDLKWLVPDTDVNVVFENTGQYDFDWRWEGFIASYSVSLQGAASSVTVDLKGAFYALDNYLAIPQFPRRPVPYEILIAQAFDQDAHPCRLGRFQILWPEDWDNDPSHLVPEFKDPGYLRALKPWGVSVGKRWTGITSRNTGSWEKMLSSYVQSKLTTMFASGGRQWSIRNLGHRRPQLFLRKAPSSEDSRIIEIDLGAPGVSVDGTRDFTQRADIIYGSGQDDAGVNYSGIQVTPDGRNTYFKPFAYSPAAYPRTHNPAYDKRVTPMEVNIRFEDGIDEVSATKVAQNQYQRFVDPGITGNITLTTDPRYADGTLCPRLLIKAGSTIRINGLLGVQEGVLVHITQAVADFKNLSIALTYDSKYRDVLTVDEVRARTRDALTPLRWLQVNKFSNTIQDLILPWSYNAGSGIIPTPAKDFFLNKLTDSDVFPYENKTTQFPPSNPSFKSWYIRLDPMDSENSSKNWTQVAIPIRMGAVGNIKLTQIAAYDKHGNVMKVKFHVSIYTGVTIVADNMPKYPHDPQGVPHGDPAPLTPKLPTLQARQKGVDGTDDKDRPVIPTDYKVNQTNPFWMQAWQEMDNNGFNWPWGSDTQLPSKGSNLVVGWGNYYEPAGYSPGRYSKGADRTGILEDTSTWQWTLTDVLHYDSPANNAVEPYAGMLFVMIYCDDNIDEPVYFMGRLVRVDPGTS